MVHAYSLGKVPVALLDYLILGRGSRTDEVKEEMTAIKERVDYIMQLL